MARKKKTVLGQPNIEPAQRQFTDREEPQESFKKALLHVNNYDYSVLTFYGLGGLGKSSLQKFLKEKYLDNDINTIYSWIDFATESNRQIHQTFRVLADRFKIDFKVKFPIFNIAYMLYLSKANPNMELKKESLAFVEEGSLLSGALEFIDDTAGGLAGFAINVLNYATKKIQQISSDMDVQIALRALNTLDADQIEEKLGLFFAKDIDNYKAKNLDKKVVIFIDTYEALWQNNRNKANRLSKDAWIRDSLVSELKQVLFVICGREKLVWEDDDPSWVEENEEGHKDLDQHNLERLSETDASDFLRSCGIENENIRTSIIQSSEGLPYYLDLCVDTYFRIRQSALLPTSAEFENIEQNKIFERFMRYLDKEEIATFEVLANARFYTKELFTLLIKIFQTGYPVTDIYELNNYSFISSEDGKFFIHNIMLKSLLNTQTKELKRDVNNFLFTFYDKQLETVDSMAIIYLEEAFHHKRKLSNIEELYQWYMKRFLHLYESGYCLSLQTTLSEMILIIETDLDLSNPVWRDNYFKILWSAVSLHDLLSDQKALVYINKMYPIVSMLSDSNLNKIEKGEFYYKTGGYKYLNSSCVEGLRELLLSARYMRSVVLENTLDKCKYDEVQATLSYAYGRIGELLQQAAASLDDTKKIRRLNRALLYHKKSLGIIDILTKKYPDNIEFFTKSGVAQERLGKVHRDLKDNVSALEHFNKAKEIKQNFFEKTGKAFGYRKILIVLFDFHKSCKNMLDAKKCILEAVSTIDESAMQSEIKSKNQYLMASYLKTFERYCEVEPDCSYKQQLNTLRDTVKLRHVEEY